MAIKKLFLPPENDYQTYLHMFKNVNKRYGSVDTNLFPFAESQDNENAVYCILKGLYKDLQKENNVLQIKKTIFSRLNLIIPKEECNSIGMSVRRLRQFVKRNTFLNVKVKILLQNDHRIYPLGETIGSGQRIIHLLLFQYPLYRQNQIKLKNVDHLKLKEESRFYWFRISNLNRYLNKIYHISTDNSRNNRKRSSTEENQQQTTKKLRRSCSKNMFCEDCFYPFSSFPKLEKHKLICSHPKRQIIEYPDPNSNKIKETMKKNPKKGYFLKQKENYEFFHQELKRFKNPIIGFADFESALVKNLETKKKGNSIVLLDEHKPISFCLIFVDYNQKVLFEKIYSGNDCVKKFFEYLDSMSDTIQNLLQKNRKLLPLSKYEEKSFLKSKKCIFCRNSFEKKELKIRDHDHYNGKYRGPAHVSCNLNEKINDTKIPIFFHAGAKYDFHLLLKHYQSSFFKKKSPSILSKNSEQFRSLSIGIYELLDSMAHLNSSLEKLASNYKLGNHSYKLLKQASFIKNLPKKDRKKGLELMLLKGQYPYTYATSLFKLKQTKKIPAKKHFYSDLTKTHISDSQHQHAKKVYNFFKCKNMESYTLLYNASDVYILGVVFSFYRDKLFDAFKLDLSKFIGIPSFSYQAMLLTTGEKLQRLTDPDMVSMIRKGIRGGVSVVNTRYAEGHNHYGQTSKPKKRLLLIDYNNLYGSAMSMLLPKDGFRWLNQEELQKFDISTANIYGKKGYFVECDIGNNIVTIYYI